MLPVSAVRAQCVPTPARRQQLGGGGGRRLLRVSTASWQPRRVARPSSQPDKAAPQDDVVSLIQDMSKTMHRLFGEVQASLAAVQATQAAQVRTLGRLCERQVRVERVVSKEDEQLRGNVEIHTVDGLIRLCSLPGFPASKERLLRELVSSDAPFLKLFAVVEPMMKAEAARLDAKLPSPPSGTCTPGDLSEWLSQARQILLTARPKGQGKPAWLPGCKGLEAYAAGAASAAAGGSSLLSFLGQEKQGGLVFMLVAAAATGQLFERLEMDGAPILRVTNGSVCLDLLEVKAQAAAVKEGARQLRAQADILLLALGMCNPALLQHGPPHVCGTVAVAADRPTQQQMEHWGRVRLAVGGEGPAPRVTMQLRITY